MLPTPRLWLLTANVGYKLGPAPQSSNAMIRCWRGPGHAAPPNSGGAPREGFGERSPAHRLHRPWASRAHPPARGGRRHCNESMGGRVLCLGRTHIPGGASVQVHGSPSPPCPLGPSARGIPGILDLGLLGSVPKYPDHTTNPSGFVRTYLGWLTRSPSVGELCTTKHAARQLMQNRHAGAEIGAVPQF